MIVVEGIADKLLVKTMGFAKKVIHRAGNKGNVFKKVRNLSKAVGIFDEDPNSEQPGELKQYEVINKKGTIKLMGKKNDKTKFLIQISPRFDDWILRRAKENNIKPGDFSLPDTPGELHRLTRLEKNKNFIDFLTKVINSDNEIKAMKKWIEKVIKSHK
ncbi:MAG: hypothetical protein PVH61_03430 [Candidatus Aminicenantes bacterium]|jgi:hypothetical protein